MTNARFNQHTRVLSIHENNQKKLWWDVGMTMYPGKLDNVLEKMGYHRIDDWNMLTEEIEIAQVEEL